MQNGAGTGAYPFRCLFIQASSIKAETKRTKLGLPENMCPAFHQQVAATDGVMPEDHMLLREKMVTTRPQPAAPAFSALNAPICPCAASRRGLSPSMKRHFTGVFSPTFGWGKHRVRLYAGRSSGRKPGPTLRPEAEGQGKKPGAGRSWTLRPAGFCDAVTKKSYFSLS